MMKRQWVLKTIGLLLKTMLAGSRTQGTEKVGRWETNWLQTRRSWSTKKVASTYNQSTIKNDDKFKKVRVITIRLNTRIVKPKTRIFSNFIIGNDLL
jgi:hypothetical protein